MNVPLDILHCDNHLVVVVKPAGMPAVPDESGDESLYDRVREWIRVEFAKPGDVFLGVVHRLDRPVSGLMVFARTSKGASRLAEQFRSRSAKKIYWAVGEGGAGRPPADSGALSQWLAKDEKENRVHILPRGVHGAKLAVTRWRVLARREGRTLYEMEPETGRAHQLRVAAATLGTPLFGDLKYGASRPLPDKSLALHARALEFAHPTREERLSFTAPTPDLDVWRFD